MSPLESYLQALDRYRDAVRERMRHEIAARENAGCEDEDKLRAENVATARAETQAQNALFQVAAEYHSATSASRILSIRDDDDFDREKAQFNAEEEARGE